MYVTVDLSEVQNESAVDCDCYTPPCAKLEQVPLILYNLAYRSLDSEMVLTPLWYLVVSV